jgi:hypothetical protein
MRIFSGSADLNETSNSKKKKEKIKISTDLTREVAHYDFEILIGENPLIKRT